MFLMLRKVVCLLALVAMPLSFVVAQEGDRIPFDQIYMLVLNYINADEEEENNASDMLYSDLYSLYSNRLNVNSASKSQLEQIPFLPSSVVEEILYYVQQLSPLHSIYELQMIEDIDPALLIILPEFMVANPADSVSHSWTDDFKYLRHRASVRFDCIAEPRKGYKVNPEQGKAAYPGIPLRSFAKYQFSTSRNFKVALACEQDAGEPFSWRRAYGFDLYRFYSEVANLGVLRKAVVGSFRLGFGQGLVFSQPYFGGAASRLFAPKSSMYLRGYGGVSEQPCMSGAAAHLACGNFNFFLAYGLSFLDSDTSQGSWSSFSSSGLHRTEGELSRRKTLRLHTLAFHGGYSIRRFNLGISAYAGLFSSPSVPAPSNKWPAYAFSGPDQYSFSADYSYSSRHIQFAGELAMLYNGAIASSNTILFNSNSDMQMSINHHYFSPYYHSFWASSVDAYSRTNGEHGASVAIKSELCGGLSFSVLGAVSQLLVPSSVRPTKALAQELRLRLLFSPNYNQSVSATARCRVFPMWSSSENKDGAGLRDHIYQQTDQSSSQPSLLFAVKYIANFAGLTLTSHLQSNIVPISNNQWDSPNAGYFLAQDISYRFKSLSLAVQGRLAIFSAPTYNNRFYCNEAALPESGFSAPYTGEGLRYYLQASYKMKVGLTMFLRIAQSVYPMRSTIGSGNDAIILPSNPDAPSHRTDLSLHVQYSFSSSKSKYRARDILYAE